MYIYIHIPVIDVTHIWPNFVFPGRGNSAFEIADRIYGSTNLIHMIGRSRVRLSWATHYVGDLR